MAVKKKVGKSVSTKTTKKTVKKISPKIVKKKVVKKVSIQVKAKAKISSKSKSFKLSDTFKYKPSIESDAVVKIANKNELFINGKFVKPIAGKYFKTYNPATGNVLCELAKACEKDVDAAATSARRAYNNVWGKMPGKERAKYLYRIARIMQERSREFAVLETIDGGKPIKESRDVDIPLAAAHFFYYAGWADKLNYAFPGHNVKPVGVCGQIIPWNFPLLMASWKLAPALAAGNTVVLKPAETTSLTALLLAEVFREAELPDGVVNIITGAGETGAALVSHKEFDKLAFTGSTDVGKIIARSAPEKKLTLELGGKSANIIFEDAAIDQAVEGIINGIYFNQGHVCCAGSRVLVEESVMAEVLKKLNKRMSTLRIGNPLDKNTDIGAINSKSQLETIQNLVKVGIKEGGNFHQVETKLPNRGYFFKPCYFEGVSSSSTVARVEIFGPVATIMSFRTPDEAISKANDTPYGLAAGIWSEKGSKIHKVAGALKAGVIWANTYNKFDPASPFGGYFESGYGREGGRHGLFPYVELV